MSTAPQHYTLSEPGKFRARGAVHVYRDGVPFYVFDHSKGRGSFTLPPGNYTVQGGHLVGRMKPRKGHRPKASLRMPLPKQVRLVFAPNPNKCSISLPDGIIIADPSLKSLPAFALVFILFHEIGHYFYKSEEECDRFAAEEMHRRGYNASQVVIASELTLNAMNGHRKSCNFDTAKRLKP